FAVATLEVRMRSDGTGMPNCCSRSATCSGVRVALFVNRINLYWRSRRKVRNSRAPSKRSPPRYSTPSMSRMKALRDLISMTTRRTGTGPYGTGSGAEDFFQALVLFGRVGIGQLFLAVKFKPGDFTPMLAQDFPP